MPARTLTLRELNRALLNRQLLLGRSQLSVPQAVEQLAGLQAQVPNPPYIGLWARLEGFSKDDLSNAMEARQVVRATMMRSTIHLHTAADHLLMRPPLQPALTRALYAFFGPRARGLDVPAITEAAHAFFAAGPRTFIELRAMLSEMVPDRDPEALAYAVRTHLPLVQVYPAGRWGYGGEVAYALAEAWLGGSLAPTEDPAVLIKRYLQAFGPASVMDFQFWAGMTGQKAAFEALRPELVTYRDEGGRELFDLPGAEIPPADAPAPIRLMPEYDNLVIAHADRTRVLAEAHRKRVFLSAARVRSTFLIDGFVHGAWKIERPKKQPPVLVFEPFLPINEAERRSLLDEGERLMAFSEDGGGPFALRFEDL